ncbi:MAG: hypothetical protein GY722_12000, partial [bacterium]|nr:hypothetical protein [bacterium]
FTSNIASDGSAIFGNLEADITVRRSTFWNNNSEVITIGEDSQALVENSILAFNTGYAVSCFSNGLIWVQCSNIYGNTNGNWTGCITGLDGIMGNMEVNPLMCNPAGGDYTLHAVSPCAPANSGSCGLIGAWPVGCWTSITVAADGSGDYPTIQDAIDAAVGDGTEVIQLFDGIYLGPGNRDIDLLGKTLIIRSLSQNAAACIIDVEGDSADPHRAFWVRNGETAATTISHLTIRGGLTFLSSGMSYPGYGAGILISDGSSLTARNLIFEGNDAFESGSAIYIHGAASHLDISNSSFTGHTRIHSSTISTYYGCGLVMDNCQIDDSNTYGIILNGYQTGVTISNCDLSPVASPTKAAIHVSYVDDSPILIENCTLQSDTGHPLIDISYSSDVTVNGCTLTWDTLDPSYWDFVSVGFSTATFDDCQFINNGPVDDTNEAMYISHSDVSLDQCSFSGFSSLTIRGIIAAFNSLLLVDTCSFTGNSDGIYYKGPEDLGLTVINSTFDGQAEWCIDAINTVAPVRVADSDFMNSGQGVRFLDSADCLIEDSNFIGNLANRTVTFSNSTGSVRRSQFEGNSASSDGGALYLLGSTVAVDSCGFTNNSSTGGGGAIACDTGEVTVSHSTFTGNDCDGAGGALYGTNADLQVMDCRFLDNQADQGGAIHGEFGTIYVEGSDFTDNTAAYAGGISAYQCDTNILTSEITGNEGTTRYGGIFLNQCASAIVDYCLITDNLTIDRGSAVSAWACDPTISSCTIVGNGGSPGTDAQV